jgi:hypothetical protein
MIINDREVIHNDNINFTNKWWKQVYELLCDTMENKKEFNTTYLKDNVSDSIKEYRKVVMLRRLNKDGLQINDIEKLKLSLQYMFAEPVSIDDTELYLKMQYNVDTDVFIEYVKNRPGIRFVYAIRHYKQ